MVTATAGRMLRSSEDVDEVFQATFFALAKSSERLRSKAAIAGWLHKTAVSCAIEVQRSNVRWNKKKEQSQDRADELGLTVNVSHRTDPSLKVANEELEQILDEELTTLPTKFRIPIVLCDLEGIPQKQAATELNLPTTTVRNRLLKGRRLLRARLVRRGASLSVAGLGAFLTSSSKTSSAMATEMVADVTAKTMLYVAGKTAAEIGVASSVIQTANKVILAMKNAKLATILLTALALTVIVGPMSTILGIPLVRTTNAVTVVSPAIYANSHAPDNSGAWPPSSRSQLIFDKSLFAELPTGASLTEVSLRPDESDRIGQFGFGRLNITIATTETRPDDISQLFTENTASAGPSTVVYEGAWTGSAENGELSFDYRIPLQKHFAYSPADGNLLVDLIFEDPLGTQGSVENDFGALPLDADQRTSGQTTPTLKQRPWHLTVWSSS